MFKVLLINKDISIDQQNISSQQGIKKLKLLKTIFMKNQNIMITSILRNKVTRKISKMTD